MSGTGINSLVPVIGVSKKIGSNLTEISADDFNLLLEYLPDYTYKITNADPTLYGGTTIYLTTNKEAKINTQGIGEFYNPKYADTAIFNNNGTTSYTVGQYVIWGGFKWTCNTNEANAVAVSQFALSSKWTKIAYNTTDYNLVADIVKYDIPNGKIYWRESASQNIIVNEIVNTSDRAIKAMQWGKTSTKNVRVLHAYSELINFNGSGVDNAQFHINSVLKDNYFSGTTSLNNILLQHGFIEDNTFINTGLWSVFLESEAKIINNTFNGSSITRCRLSQYSAFDGNTCTNAEFVHKKLDNYSTINNNTFNNLVSSRNNFDSYTIISGNTFSGILSDNNLDSSQLTNLISTVSISGFAMVKSILRNGTINASLAGCVYNSYDRNLATATLSVAEINLEFKGALPTATAPTKILTKEGDQVREINAFFVQTETGIAKTFALADVNSRTIFTNANQITQTIPTNATEPIPVGSQFEITQQGDGVIILSYPGVTVNSNIGYSTQKNGTYILTKIGVNTWTFEGFIDEGVRQPYTIYINSDPLKGSDSTGQIENKSRSFQTFAVAYSALPADDEQEWEFVYLDTTTVAVTISTQLTYRRIKITCLAGTFNAPKSFTFTGSNISCITRTMTLNMPWCNINITGTSYTFGGTSLNILCKNIFTTGSGRGYGVGKLFSSGGLLNNTVDPTNGGKSFINCNEIQLSINELQPLCLGNCTINVNNLVLPGNTNLTTNLDVFTNGCQNVILNANKITNTGTNSIFGQPIFKADIKIKELSGSGTLNIVNTASVVNIDLNNLINTSVDLCLSNKTNPVIASSIITVTGNVISTNPIRIFQDLLTTNSNLGKFIFNRFTARMSTILNGGHMNFDFIDCELFLTTALLSTIRTDRVLLDVNFIGHNVIHQTTPGDLFTLPTGVLVPKTIQKYGTIKVPASTTLGTNITLNDNTPQTL